MCVACGFEGLSLIMFVLRVEEQGQGRVTDIMENRRPRDRWDGSRHKTHPPHIHTCIGLTLRDLILTGFPEPLTIISPAGDKPMGFHVIFKP